MDGGKVESGFINSQPSMVEFLTSLPILDDVSVHVDVLATSATTSSAVVDDLNGATGFYGAGDLDDLDGLHDDLPVAASVAPLSSSNGVAGEYPWMKEKKTGRKSNSHRKSILT